MDAMTRDLRAATAVGKVKPADIDAWKARGLQLLDDIEARLPDLAERLGLDQKPADIHAVVARYRALFAAVSSAPAQPVLLLPYTPGLTRFGTGSTWVTTPAPTRTSARSAGCAPRGRDGRRSPCGNSRATPDGKR